MFAQFNKCLLVGLFWLLLIISRRKTVQKSFFFIGKHLSCFSQNLVWCNVPWLDKTQLIWWCHSDSYYVTCPTMLLKHKVRPTVGAEEPSEFSIAVALRCTCVVSTISIPWTCVTGTDIWNISFFFSIRFDPLDVGRGFWGVVSWICDPVLALGQRFVSLSGRLFCYNPLG